MRLAYICADPGVPVFGRKGASVHVQEVDPRAAEPGRRSRSIRHQHWRRRSRPIWLQCHCTDCHRVPKGDPASREQAALAANTDLALALERHGPFDIVYERYSLWSYAGMRFARDADVPGILEVNAPLIDEQAAHRRLVNRDAALMIAVTAFAAATVVVAVSNEVAEYVRGFDVDPASVHVIPNGVNTKRFSPGQPAILPADPGVLHGRLRRHAQAVARPAVAG